MDAKKNGAKEVLPQITEDTPSVEEEIEFEFNEIEMEPMAVQESEMNTAEMPDVNTPCWHCPMMTGQPSEADIPMEEEVPVPLIPMYEMEADIEVAAPMAMRGYVANSIDFGYTKYNYRDYEDVEDDVEDILEKITNYHPGIFKRLAYFGIPFSVSKNFVRRIIMLTLNYR
jgi:hypothetical protein